jgi:hypothetical protein
MEESLGTLESPHSVLIVDYGASRYLIGLELSDPEVHLSSAKGLNGCG